jgi:hypothetical protein
VADSRRWKFPSMLFQSKTRTDLASQLIFSARARPGTTDVRVSLVCGSAAEGSVEEIWFPPIKRLPAIPGTLGAVVPGPLPGRIRRSKVSPRELQSKLNLPGSRVGQSNLTPEGNRSSIWVDDGPIVIGRREVRSIDDIENVRSELRLEGF